MESKKGFKKGIYIANIRLILQVKRNRICYININKKKKKKKKKKITKIMFWKIIESFIYLTFIISKTITDYNASI